MYFVLGAGNDLVWPQRLYAYTRNLLQLDSRRAPVDFSDIRSDLRRILTLLRAQEWEWSLRDHPDRKFCDYLLRGMMEGFRVGFSYSSCSCVWAKSNMRSALENQGGGGRVPEGGGARACGRVHQPRPFAKDACELIWGNFKEPSSRQVEANRAFVSPHRSECERDTDSFSP